jgi:hypothetical protein
MSPDQLPEPPPPPYVRRQARLYPYQWIGHAILAILPVVAAVGLFGESFTTTRASAGSLEVAVSYPDRLRYWQVNQIEVHVRNVSAAPLDSVRVSIDSAFALRFANLMAQPNFDESFEVAIPQVPPNRTRTVLIEMRADRYGRHSGTLTIAAADTVRVPLSIMIFP